MEQADYNGLLFVVALLSAVADRCWLAPLDATVFSVYSSTFECLFLYLLSSSIFRLAAARTDCLV